VDCLITSEYRIVIHPDKTPHVNAPDAFDLLKKVRPSVPPHRHILLTYLPQAESELSDTAKRADLDAVIIEARITLLREFNPPLPASTPDSDPALRALGKKWKEMLRTKSKEMLIDEEVRRRK
jgi:DnaJ family protein C protein 8